MRAIRLVVAVLALVVFAVPAASADDRGSGGRHPSVVPVGRVAGSTGGRILGDWFVENLSRPKSASPFGGTVNLCLDVGRHDRVLAPAGGVEVNRVIEMTCTVRVGRPVVMVLPSVDCSTAEPEPFRAFGAKKQRACAVDIIQSVDIRSVNLSIDGGRTTDVHQPAFFEVSSQRHVTFPADPVFEATPGPATFVAAGWVAEIRGLKRGTHTVTSVATFGNEDGSTRVNTFIVHYNVVGHDKK